MDLQKILKNINPEILTEDVEKEINVIFESAVNEKVSEKAKELDEKYEEFKTEKMKEINEDSDTYIKEHLEPNIEKYLNHASEEFVKENQLTIENSIKAKRFDTIVEGLKKVFSENNIDAEQAGNLKNIEKELNESKEKYNIIFKENEKLKETIAGKDCDAILESLSKDLTEKQKNDFKDLVKDFSLNPEIFKDKAEIIKKRIIKEDKDDKDNTTDFIDESVNNDPDKKESDDYIKKFF